MDSAGWVSLQDVLRYTGWTQETVEALVATNPKRRLELIDGRVRCCQGHSSGVPVTLEGLEASWRLTEPTEITDGLVWHCTNFAVLESIEREGCRSLRRTHVHCTLTLNSAVGKRNKTPIGLAVSVAGLTGAGIGTWVAPNGVVMIREVPRSCIVGLVGMTRRGLAEQAQWRERFGFQ